MADVAVPVGTKTSYVDWCAIFAGAVLAAAISFVLLTAGAAIGLSLVSADAPSYNATALWFAAFWAISVPIGALLAGGYVTGRMRPAWTEGQEETDFRDGIHGALVWSVSVLIGALLAMSAAHTAGRVGGAVVAGVGETVQMAAPSVDALVRQAAPASGPNSNANAQRPALTDDQRAQIGRVLTNSVRTGSLSDGDRAYLSQTVAQVTGIPAADAEKRVNEAYDTTVKAVETARRASVATGLITATALLMSLVAAWYAAQRGGHHRDTNRPARFF
jgi:hypothetical protein